MNIEVWYFVFMKFINGDDKDDFKFSLNGVISTGLMFVWTKFIWTNVQKGFSSLEQIYILSN